VTAYTLAATVTTPLYGKLGDMYGRKKLFITAIVIFLVGSALSGPVPVHGPAHRVPGAAGPWRRAGSWSGRWRHLVTSSRRVSAASYMGYMMSVMMLATIAGPLAGGYITDTFSWRWIFYINLPVAARRSSTCLATLRVRRARSATRSTTWARR